MNDVLGMSARQSQIFTLKLWRRFTYDMYRCHTFLTATGHVFFKHNSFLYCCPQHADAIDKTYDVLEKNYRVSTIFSSVGDLL